MAGSFIEPPGCLELLGRLISAPKIGPVEYCGRVGVCVAHGTEDKIKKMIDFDDHQIEAGRQDVADAAYLAGFTWTLLSSCCKHLTAWHSRSAAMYLKQATC